MYNVIFIISRSVFLELQENYLAVWLTLDYLSDTIYLMDMFVSSRTGQLVEHYTYPKPKHKNTYNANIPYKYCPLSMVTCFSKYCNVYMTREL